MERKNIFALRLRQYAETLDKAKMAIRIVDGLGLADDKSGIRTPSRQSSREEIERLSAMVRGYCIAVDDHIGYGSHGRTEALFYAAMEKGLHRVEPFKDIDSDSGYPSVLADEKRHEADLIFAKELNLL